MTKRKWAIITGIVVTVYGAFLVFQAFWPGWSEVQTGLILNIAKCVGGLVLVSWGVLFFLLKR